MLDQIRLVLVAISFAGGIFFFLAGTVGLIRLPDNFSKLHATTKCDTLGAGLILLALAIICGFQKEVLKIILIVIFVWITNMTSAHLIAYFAFFNEDLDVSTVKVVEKPLNSGKGNIHGNH